jgi:predicted metal-dependent peptidase
MNDSGSNIILRELEQVIIDLLIRTPFFGRLLAKTVKVVDSKYFGVSLISHSQQTVQLCINPDYWNLLLKGDNEILNPQLRRTILKKQVIHFIFDHDLQFHEFKDKTLFILAAELVVNQYLEEKEKKLMPLANIFQDLEFPSFKTLGYYYQFISEKNDDKNYKKLIDLNAKHFEYWKTWEKQLTKLDKELDWHFRKQFILESFSSKQPTFDSAISAPLIEYLDHLKNETLIPINWKRILRLFCNCSNRTKLVNTIHRNSKRYGTFPGTRIRKQSRILVALDTSRSIKAADLKLFFKEINLLWKQKAEIKVVECDTHIRQEYNYEGAALKAVKGRGNTDFNDPIQYSNEKYHPDALIYFTDGFGPKPRIKSIKPIIWVINRDGIKIHSKAWNDLPGRKVKMNTIP